MKVFCGIDWAENHHDVAVVDGEGQVLARARITDDVAGFAAMAALLADHGDGPDQPTPVAIETSRGLLVACLRATGRPVYPINPLAVARYRDRHSVARKKSDAGDALVLANILRTDAAHHRPLPDDSELAQAISVLPRAQQDAVWDRVYAHNKLRSLLREHFPACLDAFVSKRGGIMRPEARAILAAAPTPTIAARLTRPQLTALLRRAGRIRSLDVEVERIHAALRVEHLRQPAAVEAAMGRAAVALVRQLDVCCDNANELEAAAVEHLQRHPDAKIITSLPGLAGLGGARLLGEIGDDRNRFDNARCASPGTVEGG